MALIDLSLAPLLSNSRQIAGFRGRLLDFTIATAFQIIYETHKGINGLHHFTGGGKKSLISYLFIYNRVIDNIGLP